MYELDGKQITLKDLQAEADKQDLTLEEFVIKYGVKKIDKEPLDHISREEFDFSSGRKVEKDLVKKLKRKYANTDYEFDEARMGADAVRVKRTNDTDWTVFNLRSNWNANAMGVPIESMESQYDNFINFLDSDNATQQEKNIFRKSNLKPSVYPNIYTGETVEGGLRFTPTSKMSGTGEVRTKADKRIKKQASHDEIEKLLTSAERNLREILHNPAQYDITSLAHSADSQSFDDEQNGKIQKLLYEKVQKETGINMPHSEFMKLITGLNVEKGLFDNTKMDVAMAEKWANYIKAQADNQDKDPLKGAIYESFVDKMLGGKDENGNYTDKNRAAKREIFSKIMLNIDKINILKESLLKEGTDKETIKEQITELETEINGWKKDIKDLARTKGRVINERHGDTVQWSEDEYLSSSFFEGEYSKNSAVKIADSYNGTKATINNEVSTIKASDPSLSDYDAMGQYYGGLFNVYYNLQKEATEKNIKIDLSHYRDGFESGEYQQNEHIRRLIAEGKIDPVTLQGEATYAELHKWGMGSRKFDGVFDMLRGSISKEDLEWIETHDDALDDNEGARRAMFELYELNTDPDKIEKPGFVGNIGNTGFKAFATTWGGLSELEADNALAKLGNRTNTKRYILDQVNELASDFNYQNRKEIEKGNINALTFTEEQAENLERGFWENVSEGVGHFMPLLVELGLITAATGATGVPARLVTGLRKAKNVYDKMKYHVALAALEEAKMQFAGFKPTSGAAFYTGGQLTSGIGNFSQIFGNKWRWLNPLWSKTVKSGPVGAASMELASVTELAWEDMMGHKDFRGHFNSMYGDLDEVAQRLITNSLVFSIVGATSIHHLKKSDFMTTGQKRKTILALLEKQELLEGKGKPGRNIKPENLKGEAKEKWDGYQKTIETLYNMWKVETMAKELDPKDAKFEETFQKRYTDPFNQIIKEAVGKNEKGEYYYKGYDVKFVDQNSVEAPSSGGVAEFIPGKGGKDLVIISREVYERGYKGKEIHEMIGHAAFNAITSRNPNLKRRFNARMVDVFRKYDKKIAQSLLGLKDGVPIGLKDIIEKIEGGRSNEIKSEEYLAYMLEAFARPELYYDLTANTVVKEMKQEFTSFFEEYIPGYVPKIRTAEDFIGYIGRLQRDIAMGSKYEQKLKRYVNLQDIDLLEIDFVQSKAKSNLKSTSLFSKNIVQENKRLSEKLIEAREKGNEELIRAVEGKLLQNNMPLIKEFVNDFFQREKGGEKAEFEAETMFEVIKLTKSYLKDKKSTEGQAEFGAYLNSALYGTTRGAGGGMMGPIGRQGNILARFEKTKRPAEVVSIDADGNFLQLEGGLSAGGSVGHRQAEAGLIHIRRRFDISNEQIKAIESKIDFDKLHEYNYRDLESITIDYTMEMVGGIPRAERLAEIQKLFNEGRKKDGSKYTLKEAKARIDKKYLGESTKYVKNKLKWLFEGITNGYENWKTGWQILPRGAMLETGKAKIEGLSTNIQDILLNGFLYQKTLRVGETAQASAAKTGKTSGLKVQDKIPITTKAELAKKFGIVLDKDGNIDFTKTKIKAQSKQIRQIDGFFVEIDRAIRNQVTRERLEKDYETNPELADNLTLDALLNQMMGGKSEHLASKDLMKELGIRKHRIFKQVIGSWKFRSKNAFEKQYGKDKWNTINDYFELEKLSQRAEDGISGPTRLATILKNHPKWRKIYMNSSAAVSSAKFRKDPIEMEKFIRENESLLELFEIPKEYLEGNKGIFADLVGIAHAIVGSPHAKKNTPTKNKIFDAISKKAKKHKLTKKEIADGLEVSPRDLPKELLDRLKNLDWNELRGAYDAKTWGHIRKVWELGVEGGGQEYAKKHLNNKAAKAQRELYDIWNSILEHWVHSGLTQKIRDRRLGHVFKLKKNNAELGSVGERVWSPRGYLFIPHKNYFETKDFTSKVDKIMKDGGYWTYKKVDGEMQKSTFIPVKTRTAATTRVFKEVRKYEHLKSSNEMSLESVLLIAERKWSTKGKQALAKYRGIYGLLSEFNMIDFIEIDGKIVDAKTSTADIYRFGKNLDLAKHIYSAKSGFRKTLYEEMIDGEYKYQVKNIEKIIKNNITDQAIIKGREKKQSRDLKGISVFDFDQTVATTKSMVKYEIPRFLPDGRFNPAVVGWGAIPAKGKLTAIEFAIRHGQLAKYGAKFDFKEFEKVIKGKKGPFFNVLEKKAGKFGTGDIFILTARPQSAAPAIKDFMKSMGINIPLENIKGLESGKPEAKSDWIKEKFAEGYNDFYFADDMLPNIKAVRKVLNQLDVKSDVQQALATRDLNKDFNDIIEKKTGIASEKIYSRSKGQVQGANKGRFKFWVPPSAEDFVGLIYPTLARGKTGDAQMAWYKKNLLDPFARGENAIANERGQLMRDFHALKNEIKDVPKGLRKIIKEGPIKGYNNEQAMRVYIWNKQGMKVPELSKTDLKNLVKHVENNQSLKEFAERLILINKGDGYAKPRTDWLAGTVTTDLFEGLNTTKRQKHLKEWIENKNIIFSKENLNKYEAAFGKSGREALENILERMESGQNRKKLGGYFQKLENEVLDWTNNSVGAIMFLNSRSAVLQTISAINYINFRENNPLAAARAVANFPQFIKDFNYLFNSEYLVQRRDGLKININEAEIAEMAETSTNKPKAMLAYLLKKGFILTRHADSFAIASGGASFYRNRINAYIKQVNPETGKRYTKQEAKEKAFIDFRELTEEAQQSSRTDRISAQQASGLGRVVLAFANTPMQYVRLQKRAIQDLYNGRGDAKTNLSKIVYYGFVQNLIFNALQQAMFAIGFDEDPDNQKQIMNRSGRLINGMLDSQLRGLGYGGAAVAAIKNILHKISEEHSKGNPKYADAAWEALDFSPPISSKVTKVRSALRTLEYDLDEMKSMGFSIDNPALLASADVLSAGFNLPVDRVIQKMINIQDAMDEDNEMWAKVALLAGWQEWELGLTERQIEELRRELRYSKGGTIYDEPADYESTEYEVIEYE